MQEFASRRVNMVNGQILTNKVTDEKLAEALLQVPREEFVPRAMRAVAYLDEDIPVADGRYLMEPMIFARMLEVVDIEPDDLVLDVGCGTGYSTAVMARLAASVVALEENEEMSVRTDERLTAHNVDNAAVIAGPLAEGCPSQAPYNVIFVNGAVEFVPDAWTEQLADGGRMIVVVRRGSVGQAVLHVRAGEVVSSRPLFDANVPLLPGFAKKAGFSF